MRKPMIPITTPAGTGATLAQILTEVGSHAEEKWRKLDDTDRTAFFTHIKTWAESNLGGGTQEKASGATKTG